jgi:hypothetical protein
MEVAYELKENEKLVLQRFAKSTEAYPIKVDKQLADLLQRNKANVKTSLETCADLQEGTDYVLQGTDIFISHRALLLLCRINANKGRGLQREIACSVAQFFERCLDDREGYVLKRSADEGACDLSTVKRPRLEELLSPDDMIDEAARCEQARLEVDQATRRYKERLEQKQRLLIQLAEVSRETLKEEMTIQKIVQGNLVRFYHLNLETIVLILRTSNFLQRP